MSLSFIYKLQLALYEHIRNNEVISNLTNGVYLFVRHDAPLPFVLINILKVTNLMSFAVENYEVDFQICIFSKDKTQDILLKITGEISEILIAENLSLESYKVVSISSNVTELVRGQDLSTTKMIINYKALIQGI